MLEPKEDEVIVLGQYYGGGQLCGIYSSVEKAISAAKKRANEYMGGYIEIDDRDHEIIMSTNVGVCLQLEIWKIDTEV